MTSHVNVKVFILSSFTLLKEKKTLPPQLDGCNCCFFFFANVALQSFHHSQCELTIVGCLTLSRSL